MFLNGKRKREIFCWGIVALLGTGVSALCAQETEAPAEEARYEATAQVSRTMELAGEQLRQAQKMAGQGVAPEAAKALAEYRRTVNQAWRQIQNTRETADRQEAFEVIDRALARDEEVLRVFLQQVPGELKSAVRESLTQARRRRNETAQHIGEVEIDDPHIGEVQIEEPAIPEPSIPNTSIQDVPIPEIE
ncbi:MAG: hypothetical protein GF333_06805 [Candidatus Omnitrophica bacterium]|nr:hypothetical protein [Candidatus Omnitrophota bacterium]